MAGQRAAVSGALGVAGVAASSLSYVECHATGTLIGDGIEARALTDALAASDAGAAAAASRGTFISLGSIKGNLGHANAAAGVTGLHKALLCLSRAELVPTAHFAKLNRNVHLAGTPLAVHQAGAVPWARHTFSELSRNPLGTSSRPGLCRGRGRQACRERPARRRAAAASPPSASGAPMCT